MVSRLTHPDDSRPSSSGWDVASLLLLLGVAVTCEYLFPGDETRTTSPPSAPRSHWADRRALDNDGRGRHATAPSKIPARGWKDILLRVYANISKHRILALAAGMTYYSILAIFPAIAALVAVYGLFSDPSTIARHLDQLGWISARWGHRRRPRAAHAGGLQGIAGAWAYIFVGLGVSLWSSNAAMKSLFDTLNIVHDEEEKRGFLKLNAISLGFTIGGVLFVLAALGSILVVPILLQHVGLSNAGDLLLRLGRWPAMYLILTFALAVIYRYGPSRVTPKWRWITWGSAMAALLWLAVSGMFSWYAANFGNFNETYGSLGAVIGFMTWLWISAIVILLGAEIDAEIEHQTARDTTTGAPKPMGVRGARMADTVGAAQG